MGHEEQQVPNRESHGGLETETDKHSIQRDVGCLFSGLWKRSKKGRGREGKRGRGERGRGGGEREIER